MRFWKIGSYLNKLGNCVLSFKSIYLRVFIVGILFMVIKSRNIRNIFKYCKMFFGREKLFFSWELLVLIIMKEFFVMELYDEI